MRLAPGEGCGHLGAPEAAKTPEGRGAAVLSGLAVVLGSWFVLWRNGLCVQHMCDMAAAAVWGRPQGAPE